MRSRLVARDLKSGDKERDDLFAEAPPLEAKRLLLSRAATATTDGHFMKLLFMQRSPNKMFLRSCLKKREQKKACAGS